MADPDLCRWGKLNDRQTYGVIAVDLDRLLAAAAMNKYEQRLMQLIRERSWGTGRRTRGADGRWPDATPVQLSMSALGRLWGVTRQRLVEARRSLVDDLLLIDSPAGLLINKTMHLSPRFSEKDIIYAKDA